MRFAIVVAWTCTETQPRRAGGIAWPKCRWSRQSMICIRILRRSGMMWTTTEEFTAICYWYLCRSVRNRPCNVVLPDEGSSHCFLSFLSKTLKLLSIVRQCCTKRLLSFNRFLFLLRYKFTFSKRRIIVYRPRKGGKWGRYLSCHVVKQFYQQLVSELWCDTHCHTHIPCSAGDVVAGDSANVSRSCRIAVDCLRAELKREFFI